MRSKYYVMIEIAVIIIGIIAISGCVQNQQETPQNITNSQNASQSTVSIQNFTFSPNTLTVKTGTNVTWINKDFDLHDVTSDSGSFESRDFKKGENYTHNFTKPGEYPYYCEEHPSMRGKIIVQ